MENDEEVPKLDTSETNQNETGDDDVASRNNDGTSIYSELLEMELWAMVPNSEDIDCEICMEHCKAFSGVILRDCLHSFCKVCLAAVIHHSDDPTVLCPAKDCSGKLLESEIRTLVSSDEFKRWLDRGLLAAEKSSRSTFHCCMRDCIGWAYCEPDVENFPCPVCKKVSCVPCKDIHEGESCVDYKARHGDLEAGSQVVLQNLIASGQALSCPECSIVITKSVGCDWIQCSACKTEICWVTRGRRWGPKGNGDTTGGCRCRYSQGKPCHPSCRNCH